MSGTSAPHINIITTAMDGGCVDVDEKTDRTEEDEAHKHTHKHRERERREREREREERE